MPFGVELPESFDKEEKVEEKPEETKEVLETKGLDPTSTETPKDILDLDKLERVKWGGKEWSIADLEKATLRQEDYSRKTAELAETRKYADNFASDLQTVIQNPQRLNEFRKIYPKQYVDVAEKVLASRKEAEPKSTSVPSPMHDPRVDELQSKITAWEQAQHKAEVEKINSWLDNQFDTLSKKYTYADRDVVLARAQIISDQGHQVNEKVLDKLFKENDAEVKVRWDKMYKEKATKQLETGAKSKDIGAGGGIPGAAPRGFKTIKEATKAFLDDIKAN